MTAGNAEPVTAAGVAVVGLPPAEPADDDWHTPVELAAKLRCSAYTVREYLRTGHVHGHYVRRRWKAKKTVADAAIRGLDDDAQRRICGCPEITPATRRARRP